MRHFFVELVILVFVASGAVSLQAQEFSFDIVRGGCMDDGGVALAKNWDRERMPRLGLSVPSVEWDESKEYRQLVVLVEFSDLQFNEKRDVDFYNGMFNDFSTSLFEGYTRYGKGSVADYFREQSQGKLNLVFDVVGPYQVEDVARPSTNRDNKTSVLRKATLQMLAQEADRDFSPYDWDGNGYIDQVVYVCAGPAGNTTSGGVSYVGYLHPNTGSFSVVTTHDGYKISNYSASTEQWVLTNNSNCGIGTICHEFGHCLGLPDLYNTYTYDVVVDDWDVMDGGNGVNYGWCPPNYSPMERMQLGWLEPVELSEPTSVRDLRPIEDGGCAYIVRHTADEYYLLENRQQRGWDAGVPGSGLLVWHVNYNRTRWSTNTPNNYSDLGVQLVHADNMDVNEWTDYIIDEGLSLYAASQRMNSRRLSGSPYPCVTLEGVVDSLTDSSVPQSVMYKTNSEGSTYLSKAISNISVDEEGLVSFDFMGGAATGIDAVSDVTAEDDEVWYDLMGRRVVKMEKGRIYVGKKGKMVVR